MDSKKHIFFTTSGLFTFVKKDIDFLEKEYNVTVFVFKSNKKWQTPFLFFIQFFKNNIVFFANTN